MTNRQALEKSYKILAQNKVPNHHYEAEYLLSFVLGNSREQILARPNNKLLKSQENKYTRLTLERVKGKPMAYITGKKEFFGFSFNVNKHVLVPRPETELMVEKAEKIINSAKNKNIQLIDIGTGSGCIIITLAKIIKNPAVKFMAIDISKHALNTAQTNAKIHGIADKINFFHGNLLQPILLIQNKLKMNNYKFIILANLPYLTPSQINFSGTIKKEPKLALDGGDDGLKYHKKLFKEINNLNNSATLLVEIDPSQTKKIQELAKETLKNLKTTKIIKDLAGFNRVCIIDL